MLLERLTRWISIEERLSQSIVRILRRRILSCAEGNFKATKRSCSSVRPRRLALVWGRSAFDMGEWETYVFAACIFRLCFLGKAAFMTQTTPQEILARLAKSHPSETPADQASVENAAPASVAAEVPPATGESGAAADDEPGAAELADDKLTGLLDRINSITATASSAEQVEQIIQEDEPAGFTVEAEESDPLMDLEGFVPSEPASLYDARLNESLVEGLIMKYLFARGDATGRDISEQVKLPFIIVEEILRYLKSEQFVYYRDSTQMNDYVYQLTEVGRERARRFSRDCTYFGSAPVALPDYIASVTAQSIDEQRCTKADLERAFEDLLINPQMFSRLGPAVNSGRGMFLYGFPGNGKTSIAERVTGAFGKYIWIPRAIVIDGEIMRMFDPQNHVEAPLNDHGGLLKKSKIDKRWVRIERPTIIAGGELTMANLEVAMNRETGVSEAPLQLKSNCGTLVIDDFGRQKMAVDELLNRWIIPLEKRYDFLNMPGGKKIKVPFDQLIVFSTNLEPKDLCDDAFLRRIPYKIEVIDPSESEFRELFKIMCRVMGFEYNTQTQEAIDYLIETHYRPVQRPFRMCQPRDLLLQVKNNCLYQDVEVELKAEYFDFAVSNYFAVM